MGGDRGGPGAAQCDMPYYYFFRQVKSAEGTRWEYLETCQNHREAAEKERAYKVLTEEQGAPLVRRVHANKQEDAQAIIERYGPK